MDFQLSEDQSALVAALQAILQDHGDIPQSERDSSYRYDKALQETLGNYGFLDAGRDMGAVEAALVVYETAKLPSMVDVLGRGFVAPIALPAADLSGSVAMVEQGRIDRAIRNLPIARHLMVDAGDDVLLFDLADIAVDQVDSILGYPYGRLTTVPAELQAVRFEGAATRMRRLWRTGVAAEMAGAASAAIDFTLDYVKSRKVFGRAVGSFQTVQHRLAMRYGHAKSAYYLAMRAAWSGTEQDADIAATYMQSGVSELMFDLHQFNGGMGMTNEHLLHFWLYRIRALQADVGGPTAASLAIADRRWGTMEPVS